MRAVILAGGFGTRLRPLTISMPKPMVDVANIPLMEHVVTLLKSHDFNAIDSLLYYQPETIKQHFGDGKKFGVSMNYTKTHADLGTAGAVGTLRSKIPGTFLVISGDIICDFDLKAAVKFHKKRNAVATIILTRVEDPLQYGIVITKKDGRISSFLEKPTWGEVFSDTINTGAYILSPGIFKYLPEGKEVDFSKDLFPLLLEGKKRLFGYTSPGYWKDVGNLEEYLKCHYDIMGEKIKLNLKCRKIKRNGFPVWLGENTSIPEETKFEGPAIFGGNVTVEPYATLAYSCFGNGVTIGKYSNVSRSVLQTGVTIGHHCDLRETIVASCTKISDRVKTFPGAVVGPECEIGSGATLQARIKIWPLKTVEPDAFVNSSVIWADRFSRNLFGVHGINGLANIEITPEFATRLGAALGAKIGKGKYIITSRDANQSSRMIKRSIIAGLISMGVRVGDLRTMPIPVVRYEIGKGGETGGVHVRMSPFDTRIIDILFYDETGCEISPSQQKSIEQVFFKEDFQRAEVEEIGEIFLPPGATQYYKGGLINSIDSAPIKQKMPKIVCDYAFSPASLIFPEILGALKINNVSLNGVLHSMRTSKTRGEFEESLKTLSKVVKSVGGDFGFMFDVGGEKLFLVDEKGKIIYSPKAFLCVLALVGETARGGSVCIPVNASVKAMEIAKKYKMKVIKVGTTPQRIMQKSREKGVVFAGDGKGGFIFPEFQPSFDAMFSACKIVEMCSKLDVSLAAVSGAIDAPKIIHRKVPCPWGKKGFLMRKLIEEFPAGKRELIDGVKFYDNKKWILFIPDTDRACFNISSEAKTKKQAEALIEKYIAKIKNWLKTA
ncbi:MAG: sugar phosphate nucleotidyltransferase [bacterium]